MKSNILKAIPILTCLLTVVYSCKDKKAETFRTCGTVMDYDKNKYDVIKIGCQYWMKQNLRTTHYNNGDTIQKIIEDNVCCRLNIKGFYANYDSKGAHAKDSIYGKFYNWYAVADKRGLAPKGWHVATLEDWKTLENFIGVNKETGNQLRATYGWNDNNSIAGKGTDKYGFSALSTGYKNWGYGYLPDSNKEPNQNLTVFWTSTLDTLTCKSDGQTYPHSIILGLANPNFIFAECNCENFEYSVRCVRDGSCAKKK